MYMLHVKLHPSFQRGFGVSTTELNAAECKILLLRHIDLLWLLILVSCLIFCVFIRILLPYLHTSIFTNYLSNTI